MISVTQGTIRLAGNQTNGFGWFQGNNIYNGFGCSSDLGLLTWRRWNSQRSYKVGEEFLGGAAEAYEAMTLCREMACVWGWQEKHALCSEAYVAYEPMVIRIKRGMVMVMVVHVKRGMAGGAGWWRLLGSCFVLHCNAIHSVLQCIYISMYLTAFFQVLLFCTSCPHCNPFYLSAMYFRNSLKWIVLQKVAIVL